MQALDLHTETIMSAFREKSVFGLGITGQTLLQIPENGCGEAERMIGIAYPTRSAILSISLLKTLPEEERPRAIEIAAAHEAGHVLGRSGHCDNAGCIMRANEHFDDFVRMFVKQTCELCDDCARTISAFISSVGRHE